jgi:large subunit ribosomal protein L23
MSQERLMKVLLSPHVSEKASVVADQHRQFTFKVVPDANKHEVKKAVELMFKVVVDQVRICNFKGKVKRHGQRLGKRAAWKKAYVSLAEGHDINFVGAEK